MFVIDQIEGLPEEISDLLDQGHAEDEKREGFPCNFKKFSLLLKKNDQVIGALVAYTAYAEIYVDDLWVDPQFRKQGLGKKLLKELEERFQGKGYNNINLVTSHFQAPGFYEKCGFELEFVRRNQENSKLDKYFFVRWL